MPRPALTPAVAALAATVALGPSATAGDPMYDVLGWNDLVARLGGDVPDGSGVIVATVEARDGSNAFRPDVAHPAFVGKTFTFHTAGGGISSHATNVAKKQFGIGESVAPGVGDIHHWEANAWISGFLNAGQSGVGPDPMPADIRTLNTSWVGSAGSPSSNDDILRRADFVATRSDAVITVGMNNGSTPSPLMIAGHNTIAVGVRDASHAAGPTPDDLDTPGRMKPDLVAPAGVTSFATPMVNAVAAVLIETARTEPGLADDPTADDLETLRAVLAASAVHEDLGDGTWSNGAPESGPMRGATDTPYDPVVGAGTVNVNRAHLVLTGLGHGVAPDAASAPLAGHRGFAFSSLLPGASAWLRLEVPEPADEVSIALAWNRRVRPINGQWEHADLDLELFRAGAAGEPQALTGDAGIGLFADGGAVRSTSAVDPIEHLHVRDLAAGSYLLQVRRMDGGGSLPPAAWDFAVAWLTPEPPPVVPGDLDGDGTVGFNDLFLLLAGWGACPPPPADCPADLSGDGAVDFDDLVLLLSAWS